MEGAIERVLSTPTEVRVSRSDKTVGLFYQFYVQTRVGEKWLCVVVKYQPDEAFVVSPNPFRTQSSPRSLRCFGLSGPGSQFPAVSQIVRHEIANFW